MKHKVCSALEPESLESAALNDRESTLEHRATARTPFTQVEL